MWNVVTLNHSEYSSKWSLQVTDDKSSITDSDVIISRCCNLWLMFLQFRKFIAKIATLAGRDKQAHGP